MSGYAIIKKTTLKGIANAIRKRRGLSSEIPTNEMEEQILAIESGSDITDTTLTSGSQMLYPIVAYNAAGEKIFGEIETKTQNDLTISGAQVKVPAGYYETLTTKSVATTGLGKPVISVDNNGKITAKVTHTTSGYVAAGTKDADPVELSTQAGYEVTPSTSVQTAVAKGKYTTGDVKVKALTDHGTVIPGTSEKTYTGKVTVAGDSDLKASNIKSGVNIFGVAGTYSPVSNPIIATGARSEYDLFQKLTFTLDRAITDWTAMFLSSSSLGGDSNYATIRNATIIRLASGLCAYSCAVWDSDQDHNYVEDYPEHYNDQPSDIFGELSSGTNKFTVTLKYWYFKPGCTYTLHVIGY